MSDLTVAVETPAERKQGDIIGTRSDYEVPNELKNITSVKTALDVQGTPLKRGQYFGHHGTTVYNMNPSSPEAEAIYGKKVYKTKVSPNSPQAMRKQQEESAEQIKSLQHQLDVLTKMLIEKEQKPVQPEQPKSLESMSVAEVRTIAKEKGINCFQKSKGQLIAEILGTL